MPTSNLSRHDTEEKLPRHAGLRVRFVAALLDIAIMGVPIYILVSLVFRLDLRAEGPIFTAADLVNAVTLFIITVLLWVNWDGRTPGKKLMKIRIVTYPGHQPLTYGAATIRSLLSLTGAATLLLGYMVQAAMIATRDDRRGYHDLLANTCVIHDSNAT